MYFAGGPPQPGQITDTGQLDPARDRIVHIERTVAGVEGTRRCEGEVADDAAWSALLDAMEDADLQNALAHPSDLPGLVMDAGYFSCDRDGTRVARSDRALAGQPALEALSHLHAAYDRVRAQALASPSCAPFASTP